MKKMFILLLALTAFFAITLTAQAAPVLQGISITGPSSIFENTSTQYSVRAVFMDSVTKALTNTVVTNAVWSKNSVYISSVTGGLVRTASVTADIPSTANSILATYTSAGKTKSATMRIAILNNNPQGLGVNCPATVGEGTSVTCTATVVYRNATTKDVTTLSVWNLSPALGSMLNGIYGRYPIY